MNRERTIETNKASKSTDRVRAYRKRVRDHDKQVARDQKKSRSNTQTSQAYGSIQDQNSTKPFPVDPMKVRTAALINLFQFRKAPTDGSTFSNAVAEQMSKIRDEVAEDLKENVRYINPESYITCHSCGKECMKGSTKSPTTRTRSRWIGLLASMLYVCDENCEATASSNHSSIDIVVCSQCAKILQTGKVPIKALCRGWVFLDRPPTVLQSLNKYERQLISLRLPCVYSWRSLGGFGQHAYKGAPVAFANPVAELARVLPRRPTNIFNMIIESGTKIELSLLRVKRALAWLQCHNPLYKDVSLDYKAFEEISEIEESNSAMNKISSVLINCDSQEGEFAHAVEREAVLGSHGPLDGEALFHLQSTATTGTADVENMHYYKMLIRHILRPFEYRHSQMLPVYDASDHLESYFPALFPLGKGGPKSTKLPLKTWIKHALAVRKSRFASDVEFIFFMHAVLHRKRISGLCVHAPLREKSTEAIARIRLMLKDGTPDEILSRFIERMVRTGCLNASFETLKGSPAFWSRMKLRAWAYLATFGPCQLFLTISVADIIDPFVFMQIDRRLSYKNAAELTGDQRATMLANNPVAATTLFHRRIQSFLDNFLFGKTKPFGDVVAYLGRVEQQARYSPHLHLLIWISQKAPSLTGNAITDGDSVATFIEQFCTGTLPEQNLIDATDVPSPFQRHPLPVHTPEKNMSLYPSLRRAQRHSTLTKPLNFQVFNGSTEGNLELRDLMLSTQLHVCNKYCTEGGKPCRFLFPFPKQSRATIALRMTNKTRRIALAPRNHPLINSTHPMLTAMCRSNTDVTVIAGNSIPESMYVTGYAVKADKHRVFDNSALKKVKSLSNKADEEGNTCSDRKLLSAIARAATSVRTVGAQEAADFLLDNEIVFCSATVRNISTDFLLLCEGALTSAQKNDLQGIDEKHWTANSHDLYDLLPDLDHDEQLSASKDNYALMKGKPRGGNDVKRPPRKYITDQFFLDYMDRPKKLDLITAAEFFKLYEIRPATTKQIASHPDMLLLTRDSKEKAMQRSKTSRSKMVRPRTLRQKRPRTSHILNSITRGVADEGSPSFAAAALALHHPFRSAEDLLSGVSLTERLHQLITSQKCNDSLIDYVRSCHELSEDYDQRYISNADNNPSDDLNDTPFVSKEDSNDPDSDSYLEDDDIISRQNSLQGLSHLLSHKYCNEPLKVPKKWIEREWKKKYIMHPEDFKSYVAYCKNYGLKAANKLVLENESFNISMSNEQLISEQSFECNNRPSIEQVMAFKSSLLTACKTQDQKLWLNCVLSYIQFFYYPLNTQAPQVLKDVCSSNHPILTSAPGGCGKSWLLMRVVEFVEKCIPKSAVPVHSIMNTEENEVSSFELFKINDGDIRVGRLGRVAILAPSGVAAGNCNGFTIHNGLRTHHISKQDILSGLSPELQAKLVSDFSCVQVIIIDEFSMTGLILLSYLDMVARSVRSAFSDVFFGAIPLILTGDALQLPVVNGYGILNDENKIPEYLKALYRHLTERPFYLELNESIRQGTDKSFYEILMRLRTCTSSEEDVKVLNSRYTHCPSSLINQDKNWKKAPVLTSTNNVAHALNNTALCKNGEILGTVHIHSMPIMSKTKTPQAREKIARSFFNRNADMKNKTGFMPQSTLVLYPGVPLMLRSNICPSLGLSNGSIGTLVSVVDEDSCLTQHELISSAIERAVHGESHVPSLLIRFDTCYRGLIGALRPIEEKDAQLASKIVLIEPQVFGKVKGLPVSIAHSFTIHRSQSMTIKPCIIDPRNCFCMGALYVALSRAPSLSSIALLAKVTIEDLNKFRKQTEKVWNKIETIKKGASSLEPFVKFFNEQ